SGRHQEPARDDHPEAPQWRLRDNGQRLISPRIPGRPRPQLQLDEVISVARIRSIHPGFFTDEDLVSVSMAARLCVIGLGVEADDKGIFEWKPLMLKMRLFPADNIDMNEVLSELEDANIVRKFEIEGRHYGAIRNFRKFQKPKTPNDVHPSTPDIRKYVGLT